MEELGDGERRQLSKLFETLEAEGIRYVVLRKYEGLPKYVRGDVDVLVESSAFDRATEVFESTGFERPSGSDPRPLPYRILADPARAAKIAVSSPSVVLGTLGLTEPTRTGATRRKFEDGVVEIDVTNHLAYPEIGGPRAPEFVEEKMLDRRRWNGHVYVPSPVDELAHVVAHCLADYEGRFPEYYADRCETLADAIGQDEEQRRAFAELVEVLYGSSSEHIVNRVLAGEYEGVDAPRGIETEPTD